MNPWSGEMAQSMPRGHALYIGDPDSPLVLHGHPHHGLQMPGVAFKPRKEGCLSTVSIIKSREQREHSSALEKCNHFTEKDSTYHGNNKLFLLPSGTRGLGNFPCIRDLGRE